MQINSVNSSINFGAVIGPKLNEIIDKNYSPMKKLFSNEYKQIKNKIINSTETNDIIDMDFHGDIYIFGKNTNWKKKFLTQAKFQNLTFFIDNEVADEIVKKVKGQE